MVKVAFILPPFASLRDPDFCLTQRRKEIAGCMSAVSEIGSQRLPISEIIKVGLRSQIREVAGSLDYFSWDRPPDGHSRKIISHHLCP
jgi:hypothetical protein